MIYLNYWYDRKLINNDFKYKYMGGFDRSKFSVTFDIVRCNAYITLYMNFYKSLNICVTLINVTYTKWYNIYSFIW